METCKRIKEEKEKEEEKKEQQEGKLRETRKRERRGTRLVTDERSVKKLVPKLNLVKFSLSLV